MNTTHKIALAAALLCNIAASAANAQTVPDYNPSWYIAPSINAMDPDDRFGLNKNGEGLGLRFGKPVSENWDMQLGGSYSRSRQNGNTYRQELLGVDALYMFSRKAFRPFIVIGAGAERDRASIAGRNSVSKTSPYIDAGLGFQYGFTDQLAMQADVRRVHGFLHGNTFGFNHANTNYVNLGLIYAFDKSPEAVRAVAPMPVPVVETRPTPMPAPTPAPRFEKMTLSATELFEFNRAELRMPQTKLDEIATALKSDDRNTNVVISGYTDRIGSAGYNQKLSQRRANSVKAYLVGRGVSESRLSAVGKGESNPVVMCTNKKRPALIKCLEPNRRVEVEQITIERRVN